VLRRLLLPLAVLLGLGWTTAGCADDVSPAARVGDVVITHDELMSEVAEWAKSPRLVSLVTPSGVAGGPSRYSSELVTIVLHNRISFEVFRDELEEQGLEVDQELVSQLRTGLFQDPADTAQVLDELDPGFGDALLDDIAAQITVENELADEVGAFVRRAFADVEISPRYGSWDATRGAVVPPEGPRQPPAEDPLLAET
jgi:hypothetical protein